MSKFYLMIAGTGVALALCVTALQTDSSTPSNAHFNPVPVSANASQASNQDTKILEPAAGYGHYQNQLIQE